jgi:hypothetical protein
MLRSRWKLHSTFLNYVHHRRTLAASGNAGGAENGFDHTSNEDFHRVLQQVSGFARDTLGRDALLDTKMDPNKARRWIVPPTPRETTTSLSVGVGMLDDVPETAGTSSRAARGSHVRADEPGEEEAM